MKKLLGVPKGISIKWKIFLYLLGFCGLLLTVMWLFQILFLGQFYKTIKTNLVKDSANIISQAITTDYDSMDDVIENVSQSKEVSVGLYDLNGKIVYTETLQKDSVLLKITQGEVLGFISMAQENGGEYSASYHKDNYGNNKMADGEDFPQYMQIPQQDSTEEAASSAASAYDNIGQANEPTQGEPKKQQNYGNPVRPNEQHTEEDKSMQSMLYVKLVTTSNGDEMALFVNTYITPVDSTVQTLSVELGYITAIMILLSVVLALLISRKVSKPITSINAKAKILATGDYSVEFKSKGYKEINELSDTLTKTAKELSTVEGLRQELIANISHDLRTPLTLIAGYAEAMRDLPDENTPENAEIILEETRRLSTLVNDVLDISKFQSGAVPLKKVRLNLTAELKIVISRMSQLVRQKGYTLKFIYSKDVYINADVTRLCQAFYNLLLNAINFTGDDKVVMIRQSVTNNKVKIEVIDTGEGIAEKNLPYIWERYYKEDKTHKRAVTGTGLGLSIVRSIMEMHGGEYGVESKLGEGSVFWFSIDIDPDQATSVE